MYGDNASRCNTYIYVKINLKVSSAIEPALVGHINNRSPVMGHRLWALE